MVSRCLSAGNAASGTRLSFSDHRLPTFGLPARLPSFAVRRFHHPGSVASTRLGLGDDLRVSARELLHHSGKA